MMRILCSFFVGITLVVARDANMKDVEAVAEANVQEAQAILTAAQQLPTVNEQLKNIEALNAAENEQIQNAYAGDVSAAGSNSNCGASCVRDYSQQPQSDGCYPCRNSAFLAARTTGPAELLLRKVLRRSMNGSAGGAFSRKTQSPIVWMHLHKPSLSA